MSEST